MKQTTEQREIPKEDLRLAYRILLTGAARLGNMGQTLPEAKKYATLPKTA